MAQVLARGPVEEIPRHAQVLRRSSPWIHRVIKEVPRRVTAADLKADSNEECGVFFHMFPQAQIEID